MRTSSTASLLVAALVMLRRPCARNKATAQLLLERAAEHSELTPAEREACLNLAEDLDIERPEPALIRTRKPWLKAGASFQDKNIIKTFLAPDNHSRL